MQNLAGVKVGEFSEVEASPLHARTLNIPDKLVADFLEKDFETILNKYNRQMSADLALKKVFGETGLKNTWQGVKDEYNALIRDAHSVGNGELAQRLQDEMEQARTYATAMRDRLRGTYGMPENSDDIWYRTGRAMRSLNYLRLLGGMTISSATDLGSIVIKNGLGNTLGGLVKITTNPAWAKMAKAEMKSASVGLDLILSGRAKAMADLMDPHTGKTKVERGLAYAEEGFSKITLMDQWNSSLKQWAGIVTQNNMIKSINRVKEGTAYQTEIKKLAKSGISETDAIRMADEIKANGEGGDLSLSGADLWDDQELATMFKASILKNVDSTIVTPGIGDTPLWMSDSFGKILGQFKTFAFTVVNRIAIPAMQTRDMATLNGSIMMLALGYGVYAMKQTISGREVKTDPTTVVRESLDRSGLFGVYMEMFNMGMKTTGYGGASRYASRNVAGALAGPSFGLIGDVAGATHDVAQGKFDEKTAERMAKIAPYQNVFYLRGLLEMYKDD